MKLNYVAQKISDWHGVGLNLGLSANELDVILSYFCRDHPRQKVFEMLRLWRDKNNCRFTENELKAILRRALESVDHIDAVEELNNDANQVLIDAEVRGNAVVTN